MAGFKWNWQQKEWPDFYYDKEALKELEIEFLRKSSEGIGVLKHISGSDKNLLLIDILSDEALKSSEIEGEFLNRSSIQESIRQHLGMSYQKQKIKPSEYGISEMMVNLYKFYDKPLSHDMFFGWHKMLTNGRRDLLDIGRYRTHEDPMLIATSRCVSCI